MLNVVAPMEHLIICTLYRQYNKKNTGMVEHASLLHPKKSFVILVNFSASDTIWSFDEKSPNLTFIVVHF
jgi:hypothetical protein